MPTHVSITETEMIQRLPCGLRTGRPQAPGDSVLLDCASAGAEWLLREKYEGRGSTYQQLLDVLNDRWQQTPFFAARGSVNPELYNRKGVMLGRVCRRLRDLVVRYQVVQPVDAYELPLEGVSIRGSYAVVRSERRKRHALIVYLRDGGTRLRPVIPDVIAFSRALDQHRRDAGWDTIGILNWSITSDIATEHHPDPQFADTIMSGVAAYLTSPGFPVPGDHCSSCTTWGCRPDLGLDKDRLGLLGP